MTYRAIAVFSELLVYYEDAYARELNINMQALGETPATGPPCTVSSGEGMLPCPHCDHACLEQDRLDNHEEQRHSHNGRNGR